MTQWMITCSCCWLSVLHEVWLEPEEENILLYTVLLARMFLDANKIVLKAEHITQYSLIRYCKSTIIINYNVHSCTEALILLL